MKIVLFGPPASGKGTQAYLLKEALNIPHLSTGDLLRRVAQEDSEWGKQVRAVPTGHFASDELIIQLLIAELEKPDYVNGVLLDGFPRTKAQAEKMNEMGLKMDLAVNLTVNEDLLTERLINRRVHPASGRIYNLLFNPPKHDGIDDETSEPLVHRADDQLSVVQQRFADYREKTLPAVELFKTFNTQWLDINGEQDSQVVFKHIMSVVQPTAHKKGFQP